MENKTKQKALKLFTLTNKRRNGDVPVISFFDLEVEFQDPNILDLRDMGICTLGIDKCGHCGVSMRPEYASMSFHDFYEYINK